MAPNQQLPKAPITKFFNLQSGTLKKLLVLIHLYFVHTNDFLMFFFRYAPIYNYHQFQIIITLFLNYVFIYRYISDINVLCSIYCKHMSLLNVESYVFINVFCLVLFCIHFCVDDIIKEIIIIYNLKFTIFSHYVHRLQYITIFFHYVHRLQYMFGQNVTILNTFNNFLTWIQIMQPIVLLSFICIIVTTKRNVDS